MLVKYHILCCSSCWSSRVYWYSSIRWCRSVCWCSSACWYSGMRRSSPSLSLLSHFSSLSLPQLLSLSLPPLSTLSLISSRSPRSPPSMLLYTSGTHAQAQRNGNMNILRPCGSFAMELVGFAILSQGLQCLCLLGPFFCSSVGGAASRGF